MKATVVDSMTNLNLTLSIIEKVISVFVKPPSACYPSLYQSIRTCFINNCTFSINHELICFVFLTWINLECTYYLRKRNTPIIPTQAKVRTKWAFFKYSDLTGLIWGKNLKVKSFLGKELLWGDGWRGKWKKGNGRRSCFEKLTES